MRTKEVKRVIYFSVVTVISIVAAYFFSGGRLFDSTRFFFLGTLWSMSIWFTQSLGNGYIIDKLDERIPWLEKPWKRLIIGFLALVTFSFVAFQIVQITLEYFVLGYYSEGIFMSDAFWDRFYESGKIAVIVSLAISTVMTAVGFFRSWRLAAVNAEKLKNEVMVQQYETLKNQMNPHFLFNSLNVLSELVYEDQDQAVRFIRKLSDVYRYVLDSREKEVVPLAEEVAFVEAFASLLKERFGANFKFQIHNLHPQHQGGYIVPMALQLLLENAVKHNVISSSQPLQVDVYLEQDAVRMVNKVQLKRQTVTSSNLGLNYLRNQYQVLGGLNLAVVDAEGEFSVSVPFVHIENATP